MSSTISRNSFNELKPSSRLTGEVLRSLLRYDPDTGGFLWLQTRGGRSQAGQRAGTESHHGYRSVTLFGVSYRAHRLAWLYMTGQWPVAGIDHIDGDTGNNRWTNLRAATQAENGANRKVRQKNNSSGHRGITKLPGREAWRVRFRVRGQQISVGCYQSYAEAQEAYQRAAREHYGEFARHSPNSVEPAHSPDAPWLKERGR